MCSTASHSLLTDTDAVAETAFEIRVPIITATTDILKIVSFHTGLGCEIQPYFILIISTSTQTRDGETFRTEERKPTANQSNGLETREVKRLMNSCSFSSTVTMMPGKASRRHLTATQHVSTLKPEQKGTYQQLRRPILYILCRLLFSNFTVRKQVILFMKMTVAFSVSLTDQFLAFVSHICNWCFTLQNMYKHQV